MGLILTLLLELLVALLRLLLLRIVFLIAFLLWLLELLLRLWGTKNLYPSDNFDSYNLWITRQGGPTYNVPIAPSLTPPMFGPDPLRGTSRVGDLGWRCDPLPTVAGCPVPPPMPPKVFGTLTILDLRVFDDVCAASLVPPFTPPSSFALKRGTCCGYTFQLYAKAKTRSDWTVRCHWAWSLRWAVCICNDLPKHAIG
jgi:hypothetical protein